MSKYPPCANATYTECGQIDVSQALYDCASYIPGSLLPPSYFSLNSSEYPPTVVQLQIKLNNLVEVNDIESNIILDFYLKLYWNDTRLNMPFLFDNLNPAVRSEGIDITNYIRSNTNQLNFWLPDLMIKQATSTSSISESIKMYPSGLMFWTRHLQWGFMQSQMVFKSYPLDHQNFSLVMQSYAHDTNFIDFQLLSPPVQLNYAIQEQEYTVEVNQLWNYDKYTAYIQNQASPTSQDPNRQFSTAFINFEFTRQSRGVIYRLGIPVTILLVIVGFSFWGNIDKRVDVALSMVLVVAALYIVMGQIIPQVGYLTQMDVFITTTFGLLSFVIYIHYFVIVLDKSAEKYPMTAFGRDFIEILFRLLWIPFSIIVFMICFDEREPVVVAILVVASTIAVGVFLRRLGYLSKSLESSIIQLRIKSNPLAYQEQDKEVTPKSFSKIGVVESDYSNKYELTMFEKRVLLLTASWYPGKPSFRRKSTMSSENLGKLLRGSSVLEDKDVQEEATWLPAGSRHNIISNSGSSGSNSSSIRSEGKRPAGGEVELKDISWRGGWTCNPVASPVAVSSHLPSTALPTPPGMISASKIGSEDEEAPEGVE